MGLTDLQVKKIVPRNGRFEVSDGKGLSVRITPNGTKTWVFRYQFKERPRRMTLGNYPVVGLADARELHAKAMQDIQRGIDPGQEAKERKKKFKAEPTMKDIIDELWKKELKNKKSGPETMRLLQKDVTPAWGKRRVSDIKRRDIVLLLDRIEERGAPITRNRVHSALTRLFNFGAERGIIDDSPCTRIRKLVEKSKTRVLTDDEIKLLWDALDTEASTPIFLTTKLALKIILLTGQRSGEICGMTDDELDLEQNIWTIPANRMKNNQEHKIPLTDTMRRVIDQARGLFGDGESFFVFPSPRHASIKPHSLSKAILRNRQDMGIQNPFTPHDIRQTVRTRLAELKIKEFIAERVLGHKLEGMLAVYNQHDYLPEKRQALEAWEKRLKTIVGVEERERNGNVISITEARSHV